MKTLFILYFCLYFTLRGTYAEIACDEWTQFKDEKCIKVFENLNLQTYDNAVKVCSEYGNGSAITIHSIEEQQFVINYLQSAKIVDTVWLGLVKANASNSFYWIDGVENNFTNWAESEPKSSNQCVQMSSDPSLEHLTGKWTTAACSKHNMIVCQKPQIWTVSKLQSAYITLRLQYESTAKKLTNTESELYTLRNEYSVKLKDYEYVTNCANSKVWAFCKVFYYYELNETQVIAVPRNNSNKSWDEANSVCKKYGAIMLTVKSYIKQYSIQALPELTTYFGVNVTGYIWTSGHKDVNSGRWKWSDGSDVDNLGFWYTNDPNSSTYNCLAIGTSDSAHTWYWYYQPCNAGFRPVCEFNLNQI